MPTRRATLRLIVLLALAYPFGASADVVPASDADAYAGSHVTVEGDRSEERRVGKECRL